MSLILFKLNLPLSFSCIFFPTELIHLAIDAHLMLWFLFISFLIDCLLGIEGLVTQVTSVNFVYIFVKSIVISKYGDINIIDNINVISKW